MPIKGCSGQMLAVAEWGPVRDVTSPAHAAVAENTKNAVADSRDEVWLGSIENLSAFDPELFFSLNESH
jgi:hypothetical protein